MLHPTALIADVKGSRQIENWPEVFDILKKTLRNANKRFADQILVKFAPTVGDEFQGALKSPEKAFDVYTFIKASLPVPIYCGLGIGEVEVTAEGSAGLRGTAFYRARSALEVCKKKSGSMRIKTANEETQADQLVNVLLLLMETIENSWTKRQREILSYFRLHPEFTRESLGRQFGITQPTVSEIFKIAHYDAISAAERALSAKIGATG